MRQTNNIFTICEKFLSTFDKFLLTDSDSLPTEELFLIIKKF